MRNIDPLLNFPLFQNITLKKESWPILPILESLEHYWDTWTSSWLAMSFRELFKPEKNNWTSNSAICSGSVLSVETRELLPTWTVTLFSVDFCPGKLDGYQLLLHRESSTLLGRFLLVMNHAEGSFTWMKVALAEVTNGMEIKDGLPDDFEKYKQGEPLKNFGKRTGTVMVEN